MEYLSQAEKDKVGIFAEDTVLVEAIRKILFVGLYTHGVPVESLPHDPTINFAMYLAFQADKNDISNEKIGADLRAKAEGIRIVEQAFSTIAKMAPAPKPEAKPKNRAR